MLKLEFTCETDEEARIYLNAKEFHNLCHDFYNAIKYANKHNGNIQHVVETFYEEFQKAAFANEGVY